MTQSIALSYAQPQVRTRLLPMILVQLALAGTYFVGGKIGLMLAFHHPSATAVWPPTGIALVAVLLLGAGVWPAILAGAFLVNISTGGTPVPAAAGIALGNTLEALLGAWLVTRFARGVRALEHPHDVIRFAVLAGVVSTTVSATIGPLSLGLSGTAEWRHFGSIWLTWWLGDASSNFVVAPFLLAWINKPLPRPSIRRLLEGAAMMATVIFVGLVVVEGWFVADVKEYPLAYLGLIPLIWAAMRFGARGAATAALVMSAIAIRGTLAGTGPFSLHDANESLLLLQTFMATITLTALILAAVVRESDRVHDALRQAGEEAHAANSAKDRFIAVLSHELRTPLTPVLASLSALESDPVVSPHLRDELDMIRRNVKLEARLIDELLDLNRISRGKMELRLEPLDIRKIMRDALAVGQSSDGANPIHILNDWSAINHWVRADPLRLGQVFRNLLDNARKFMPSGGTITVRTANTLDGMLRVDVIDSGVGIPPDLVPRLFEPFEQAHPVGSRFGGLGIGLAVSRSIVEALGGLLEAHSDGPGRGAKFSVTLPTSDPPASPRTEAKDHADRAAEPKPTPAPKPAAASLRILLVEDHPDSARALSRLLERTGYSVQIAITVAEALRLTTAHRFDLVISDVGLPDGDGLQLMRDLKRRHALRGIALTGYGMDQDVRRSLDAGFAEHLTKPIDSQLLHAAIDRLMNGSNNHDKVATPPRTRPASSASTT